MPFVLNINNTSQAAFAEGVHAEVSRIVSLVARDVAGGANSGTVRDANGNTVGNWSLTG